MGCGHCNLVGEAVCLTRELNSSELQEGALGRKLRSVEFNCDVKHSAAPTRLMVQFVLEAGKDEPCDVNCSKTVVCDCKIVLARPKTRVK